MREGRVQYTKGIGKLILNWNDLVGDIIENESKRIGYNWKLKLKWE